MHEMSIALDVCHMAEAAVGPDQASHVVVVGLDVGDDAGVDPDNLQFCLEVLLAQPPFGRARPAIQRHQGDVLSLRYLELDDETPLPTTPSASGPGGVA
jgi:Zn finger protein HypA/HybF involved in hydrogenase expression